MTGDQLQPPPLAGPLDVDPTSQVYALLGSVVQPGPGRFQALDLTRAMLDQALAGVELGEYDARITGWLRGCDVPTVATIASLMHRCRNADAATADAVEAVPPGSGDRRAVVPTAGPLDVEPGVNATEAEQQLDTVLSGLQLGAHDAAVHLWVLAKDAPTVATLASWLRRSWAAGVEAGRAERVDEQPVVAALRGLLAAEQERADRLHREAAELDHELRGERQAVQRCGQAVDDVAVAAAAAESALEDPAAGRQLVVEGLLAATERATTAAFTRGRRGGTGEGGYRP